MPERSVSTVLDELHELLERAEDLDAGDRDALRTAATEIRSAVDRGLDGEQDSGQLAGLRSRIERFETSHPTLTETLRRLIDQLSEMGI